MILDSDAHSRSPEIGIVQPTDYPDRDPGLMLESLRVLIDYIRGPGKSIPIDLIQWWMLAATVAALIARSDLD